MFPKSKEKNYKLTLGELCTGAPKVNGLFIEVPPPAPCVSPVVAAVAVPPKLKGDVADLEPKSVDVF